MTSEPFNVGGVSIYPRGDGRVGVILPTGREVVMEASEAMTFGRQLENAVTRIEFETIIRGADRRCW